jgi:hypothetical protein
VLAADTAPCTHFELARQAQNAALEYMLVRFHGGALLLLVFMVWTACVLNFPTAVGY